VAVAKTQTWSVQRIIDELRAVEARGDKAVDRFLKAACIRYYGSVSAARRAAGIERVPKWTPERVIEHLRTMVSNGQIWIRTPFSTMARWVFGDLETAYRSAGIDEIVMSWPKSKLLRVLREQRPRPYQWGYVHRLVREACVRAFGSVSAAFEAAGLPSRPGSLAPARSTRSNQSSSSARRPSRSRRRRRPPQRRAAWAGAR
jgi:hypothetical protein